MCGDTTPVVLTAVPRLAATPGVVLRYRLYERMSAGLTGTDGADHWSVTDLVVSGVSTAETFCGAVGAGTCGTADTCADSALSPMALTVVTT